MASTTSQEPVIGLDLGTTNSCAAFVDARGSLERVSVSTGEEPYDAVLGSVVLNPMGKEPVLGRQARAARTSRPRTKYIEYFKPELDRQRLRERRPITVYETTTDYDWVNENNRVVTRTEWVESGGKHSREELTAAVGAILGHLVSRAIAAGADPDSSLWLGMPVGSSSCARKRVVSGLMHARDEEGKPLFASYGQILDRLHFVLEPVAVAASAHDDLAIRRSANVLVFDHGGGTLDLSVLRYEKRRGMPRPAPVRELAAGGSDEVAGKDMDSQLLDALLRDKALAKRLAKPGLDDYMIREIVEEGKRELSTKKKTRLRIVDREVKRSEFEHSIEPVLQQIEDEIDATLARGGLRRKDIDRVFMTGGSSLIPAVQRRVGDVFSDLAEDQILRYFPDDPDGVESAITDVARGLASFGYENSLEQIVLWDVELAGASSSRDEGEFQPLFERGTKFKQGKDGRPELRKKIKLGETPDCTCFGVYEQQLAHRYLFGIADVPALPAGAQLEVRLRRDALFPELRVCDSGGRVVRRRESPTGWEHDALAVAEISGAPANQLEEFFEQDAEYLPATGFLKFTSAPLVRRLRTGDYVEWTQRSDGNSGWVKKKGRGVIQNIQEIGGEDSVPEMTSWDLPRFRFTVKNEDTTALTKLESCYGSLRLAPHAGFNF